MPIFKAGENSLYYDTIGQGEQTLILIPPGVGDPIDIKILIEKLKRNYKLIVISLPGVNGSNFNNPNIKNISTVIVELLKSLSISKPNLIGVSYGGNVAISIDEILPANKIILITSGEYFNIFQKVLLKILFVPLKKIKIIRSFYIKVLSISNLINFSNYNISSYDNILDRFLEIISYKLPLTNKSTASVLFYATKDKILNKKSIIKLKNIFQNHNAFYVNSGHLTVFDKFTEKNFLTIHNYLLDQT